MSAAPAPAPRADPAALDATDPLARFRAEFFLPPGQIYLDGNSLGLLSRRAEAHLARVVAEWRTLAIGGWSDAAPPWLALAETAAEKLAPLLGAGPDEICVTGQTTANLHQLLATLFDPRHSTRRVLLGDALNFPSDAYALASHLRLRGLDPAAHLRRIPSRDGRVLRLDDLLENLAAPDVQLAVLPAVVFTSGQLLDVATLTRKARARGVLIGWDLSHSIGAVPHALGGADGPDFAFWCHYKWLNAGPGAVGGLFLHRRHHARAPGLAGGWGVRADRRFALAAQHEPAAGAAALHIGTPPMLSLAPLLGSLELIAAAGGIAALRAKSLALTDFLLAHLDAELAPLGVTVVTPSAHLARGGHLALAHPDAWRLCQALRSAGVVADFRTPDLLRLAPSPLYTSFADCAAAIARLKHILLTRAHENFPATRALVT
ncbi:MAG: kynureninase [Verrucomicrobiota bacterium]|jgi:kynureninase